MLSIFDKLLLELLVGHAVKGMSLVVVVPKYRLSEEIEGLTTHRCRPAKERKVWKLQVI